MLVITRTIDVHVGAPADLALDIDPVTLTTAAPGVVLVRIYRELKALAEVTMPLSLETGFYPAPDGLPWSERGIEPSGRSLLCERVRTDQHAYEYACSEHAWLRQLPDARYGVTAYTFDAGYRVTYTVEVL
ncbi:hypothetical protein HQ346_24820 [Rhodococcus sp. BP-252]|uniref:hypothetical protein n=1 Tax=unclassified Rhodococcus (in: high G+C Gram-positive bacteria) TaxID=192944 RepID=UPI001C9B604A|nr:MULTISPECIES: hypothetical protein [unclassified Rhodococcus (in: high G+C Gram-positive bacteria)]MBY6414821.1 hypothetical protein [Rhodococcus sp. BP-320]MBY6419724.1 hypothetical protein [Rhodococcus sp. BP-321]MBY6424707.1 hypothetical protein [Rhodococcus sp. BP-324]MBY6429699.1 hypothetical protein [Rhodococcus sp. BP-323]MBY6434671.1 hypothetical protein [Rhodococcus sp. BP-322]